MHALGTYKQLILIWIPKPHVSSPGNFLTNNIPKNCIPLYSYVDNYGTTHSLFDLLLDFIKYRDVTHPETSISICTSRSRYTQKQFDLFEEILRRIRIELIDLDNSIAEPLMQLYRPADSARDDAYFITHHEFLCNKVDSFGEAIDILKLLALRHVYDKTQQSVAVIDFSLLITNNDHKRRLELPLKYILDDKYRGLHLTRSFPKNTQPMIENSFIGLNSKCARNLIHDMITNKIDTYKYKDIRISIFDLIIKLFRESIKYEKLYVHPNHPAYCEGDKIVEEYFDIIEPINRICLRYLNTRFISSDDKVYTTIEECLSKIEEIGLQKPPFTLISEASLQENPQAIYTYKDKNPVYKQ